MRPLRKAHHPDSKRTLPPATIWIGARANNALRRPMFISMVSVATFSITLVALVIVPQRARRTAVTMNPVAIERPDTQQTLTALVTAQRSAAAAEVALASARAESAQLSSGSVPRAPGDQPAPGDTLTTDHRTRRDSLAAQVSLVSRLITRADNAPLLGSYRALAQAPPMQGDARVRSLLDTLVEIERERDSYSAVGGVDPVFVALTARANELGRNIETLADARRTALRRELSLLVPQAASVGPMSDSARLPPDTTERLQSRNVARTSARTMAAQLARERASLVAMDEREEHARELASVGASPSAMLGAALVFAVAVGFGVVLLDEVRHPRIASALEAEEATGARVLAVIRHLPMSPERGRRVAERAGLSVVDSGIDGHQLVYQTIATAGVGAVMLTVTGDNPVVSAVVALNFAAIASDEARATLLMDTDSAAPTVLATVHLRPGAGISELANGIAQWTDVTRAAQLGRDRSIDVIASGEGTVPIEEITALLARETSRLMRQYDAVVLVSAVQQVTEGLAAVLPTPDVLYCARLGRTLITELVRDMDAIGRTGARARGIVLWNSPDPVLAQPRQSADVRDSANIA